MLANALLAHHALPKSLWGFAIVTATYLSNFVVRQGQTKPPLELFTGKSVDYSHLRVPFCQAYLGGAMASVVL